MFKKAIALLLMFTFIFVSVNFTFAATTLNVTVGTDATIEDGGINVRHFPNVSTFGDDVFVGFNKTPDEVSDEHVSNMMRISRNDGASWNPAFEYLDFPPMNLVKLANGNLVGVTFVHYRENARRSTFYRWLSTDNGANWTKATAYINFPHDQKYNPSFPGRGAFSNNPAIVLPDGSLVMTVYGSYGTDSSTRLLLARSTDNGINWNIMSTIHYGPMGYDGGFNEADIELCADGSILCVMRNGGYLAMYQTRSYDNGLTWSAPAMLPGIDTNVTASVYPQLTTMTNGTLVLSYGRPGHGMLFSIDGSGYEWSDYVSTYDGTTSGYGGAGEVSSNKLILVGDRGANWQHPTDYEIWRKFVDVVRNDVQGTKIDLKTKFLRGEMTVSTDMSYSNDMATISGAFDGNTSYNYSAFKGNTTVPSYYTISLDRTYKMTAMGICLKNGYAESADIYFSTDGVNWGAPVKSYTNAAHTAVNYSTFGTPVQARYIKVNVTNASGGWPGLNEIELFYEPDTFENDAAGSIPAGYTLSSGTAEVSNTRAYSGTKALRIHDESTTNITAIKKTAPAAKGKLLEFKYYPVSANTGNIFSILSGTTIIYQFLVREDGSLLWYDGSTWNLMKEAKVVFNTWSTIKIDAGSARANIYVNNKFAGMAGRINRTLNTFDGFSLNSGGTATTGDDFYVDDIVFDTQANYDEDTFESCKLTAAPSGHGYQYVSGNTVTNNSRAYEGNNSLWIFDNSAGYICVIKKSSIPTPTKVFEFRFNREALPNGAMFDIMGNGQTANVYHFLINDSGTLYYFNGTAWVSLTGAGVVPANTWAKITVEADMTNAKVYINGNLAGTADRSDKTAKTMDGFQFTSGSTAGTGDKYYIDNVYFSRGYYNDIDTFEKDSVGAVPAGYATEGASTTVSNTRSVDGSKSLRVYDNSTSAQAGIRKQIGITGSKTIEFDIYPDAVASGNAFCIGNSASGTSLYTLMITSNGDLKYHNGSTYVTIGRVTLKAWNHIKVEANTENAKVYLNSDAADTITRASTTVTEMDEFSFWSGSSAGTGDDFYLDNIFVNHID